MPRTGNLLIGAVILGAVGLLAARVARAPRSGPSSEDEHIGAAPNAAAAPDPAPTPPVVVAPELPPEGPPVERPVGTPRVVVDQTEYDFGRMDPLLTAERRFVFRNEGDGPLTLEPGETTCKCVIPHTDVAGIPPGGEAIVCLEWTTQPWHGFFAQGAMIHTNDPDRPRVELRVAGHVVTRLAADPAELVVRGLAGGDGTRARTTVFSQVWDRFELVDVSSTLPGATWKITPAPAERLAGLDARAAYDVEIAVPGRVAVGDVREALSMKLVPPDGETDNGRMTVTLPIMGRIRNRIGISGPSFAGDVVQLGTIDRGAGFKTHLILKVRDEHRELDVGRIGAHPDFVRVTVEPMLVGEKVRGLYRVEVEVPRTAPQCVYSGRSAGHIEIVTNHPVVPQVRLGLELAVAGENGRRGALTAATR